MPKNRAIIIVPDGLTKSPNQVKMTFEDAVVISSTSLYVSTLQFARLTLEVPVMGSLDERYMRHPKFQDGEQA